jgi:hypothetical protein
VPRLIDEAPADETITRTFQIKKPNGGTLPVRVAFRPNSVTWEHAATDGENDIERAKNWATANLCKQVASWDLEGPWQVEGQPDVAEGEMVPIEDAYVRAVPAWITSQIANEIQEVLFPNLRRSRDGQKRG